MAHVGENFRRKKPTVQIYNKVDRHVGEDSQVEIGAEPISRAIPFVGYVAQRQALPEICG